MLASDGEQALDTYERENPDLAILDYNMPGRTGVEVIQAIRLMEPPGVRMPAVILSASVTVEARERAQRAGSDEFVSKPFDAAILLQKIDDLAKRMSNVRVGASSRMKPGMVASLAEVRAARREQLEHNETSLVDPARLAELEDIARDASFMTELLRGFKTDVEGLLRQLDQCIEAGNHAALADLMHTLKGAAVGVGARQLAMRCSEMDRAAVDGGSILIRERAQDIRACFAATVAYLGEYVLRQHHASL
jgi:CheY-like chemotaxis protein/HPt (histidine-containing phosphotransfer) domain-containing protein